MKIRWFGCSGMYNCAITPLITVWRNADGFGMAVHLLKLRGGFIYKNGKAK